MLVTERCPGARQTSLSGRPGTVLTRHPSDSQDREKTHSHVMPCSQVDWAGPSKRREPNVKTSQHF